jgi:hypothetical protein
MEYEETTVLNEQTEDAGTPDALDAAFDLGFDDDGPIFGEETAKEEPETQDSEGGEADADQQEADEPEGEEADSMPESESQGEEVSEPDRAETFTLRHLGEDREVQRDEVIALAQKGMDYDRIREKWDGVKDDVQRLRSYESFLKELADARGGDIESLIDETRTRTLIAKAEAEGRTLDPSAAAARAVRMRLSQSPSPTQSANTQTAEAEQDRANEMIDRFISVYGSTVKAEDIPKEVWEEAAKTQDLVGAYRGFENRKLKDEVKKLKADLESAKQQTKNKQRSTGSTKSVGSSKTKDPFEEGWDAS